jgi:septal ring factor EnvC (AmiA/AmiB activator)
MATKNELHARVAELERELKYSEAQKAEWRGLTDLQFEIVTRLTAQLRESKQENAKLRAELAAVEQAIANNS